MNHSFLMPFVEFLMPFPDFDLRETGEISLGLSQQNNNNKNARLWKIDALTLRFFPCQLSKIISLKKVEY